MTLLPPTAIDELKEADRRVYIAQEALRLAEEHRREVVNRHGLNKQKEWPGDERVSAIGQNGGDGLHYDK